MAKKIGYGLFVAVLFAALGVWLVSSNLDSIVKGAIEKYGSAATQTNVTVSGVKISISTGAATISGLSVANPSGYSGSDALKLGGITAQLDTSSVSGSGPIVVKEIEITAPEVTYEMGAGGSNLQTIEKNAKAYAASLGGSDSSASSSGGRKAMIDDLKVENGKITLSAPMLQGKTLTVPLPPIHLTGIGKGGGATPAQIAGQVMAAITSEAAQAGASALSQQVQGLVGGALQGAGSGASDIGGQLKGLLGK